MNLLLRERVRDETILFQNWIFVCRRTAFCRFLLLSKMWKFSDIKVFENGLTNLSRWQERRRVSYCDTQRQISGKPDGSKIKRTDDRIWLENSDLTPDYDVFS